MKISSSRFDIEDGCFHQKNPKIPNLLPRSNVRYSKKSFTLTTFKMYISKGQISSVGLVCLLGYLNFLVGLVNNKHIS